MTMPAKPIIEPIERSNSPPIISSAAATAMIPSWADDLEEVDDAERREHAAAAGDDAEEDEHEDRSPPPRPSSGRAISRWASGVRRDALVAAWRSWSRPWRHLLGSRTGAAEGAAAATGPAPAG